MCEGVMNQTNYKAILVRHASPALQNSNEDIFKLDNDPKYTEKLVL